MCQPTSCSAFPRKGKVQTPELSTNLREIRPEKKFKWQYPARPVFHISLLFDSLFFFLHWVFSPHLFLFHFYFGLRCLLFLYCIFCSLISYSFLYTTFIIPISLIFLTILLPFLFYLHFLYFALLYFSILYLYCIFLTYNSNAYFCQMFT
jgi:hypothetical protein